MTCIRVRLGFAAILFVLGTVCGQDMQVGAKAFVRGIEGVLPVYASTNAPLEAVAAVSGDAVLTVLGTLSDEFWVPIAAPDTVSVWIYRDLVRDGVVCAEKSQVRSGAGLTYRPVASLDRGASVEVRGRYGDWLRIKPPPEVRFWVLRDQVVSTGMQPEPDLYTALINALTNSPPPPSELSGYALEESVAQGERVTLKGILDWGGMGAVAAPFRLMAVSRDDEDEDAVPLCNLLASEIAYGPHIGAFATVEGTRWRVKGSRLPFVVPLKIQLGE